MSLRTLLTCFALIPASLFLSACGEKDPSNRAATPPDSFIFARGADAQKLDPADVDDGESVNTLAQMLEGLVGFKKGSLEVEPRLAERVEISEDGLTYTFHIREGVRFHDGTPLNAETAAFSFRRQLDESHPAHFADAGFQYWSNLFGDVRAIETPEHMVLRFRLERPNPAILYAFASFPGWLISPAAYERYGNQLPFNPVGTGPYKFVSWSPNQAIVMERNEAYWGEPKPGFERLVMRAIPLNTSRLSELRAGTIHGLDGVQPAELVQLKNDPAFTVYNAPGLNVGYLAFSGEADHLSDPQVRRAIAMAIDREALVRLALDGYGEVARYPMPEGFLGDPGDAGPIRHDREAAREVLSQFPELLKRKITLATFSQPRAYFPDPTRVASMIRSDLEAVGLRVEIQNRDFKTHLHLTRRGDFEMALLGWIADTPDTSNFLDTFLHSKAAVEGSATNISFYRNEEMDTLLDAALGTTDPDRRAELYRDALTLWARDLPIVPLVHGPQITVLRSEIRGYALHPSGNHYFGPVYWNSGDDTAAAAAAD